MNARTKLWCGTALLLASGAVAAHPHPVSSPQAVLGRFLRFELGGGRLDGKHWRTYLDTYLDAPAGYDEPGWDVVTLVSGYRVETLRCQRRARCTVAVRFILARTRPLGDPSVASHPVGGRERVTYRLHDTAHGWRLVPDFGMPHISLATYRAHRAGAPP